MMYCHYVNDKIAGRVLIPGCWGAVIHGKHACTCDHTRAKKELEERVSNLEKIVAEMRKKIAGLSRTDIT